MGSKHRRISVPLVSIAVLGGVLIACATGIDEEDARRQPAGTEPRGSADGSAESGSSLRLGLALFRKGDLEGAEPHIAAALKRSPRDPRIIEILGAIYARSDRFQQAETSYREALAIAPDSISARLGLADVLKGTGQLERALEEFEEVRRRQPDNTVAAAQAALLLVRTGDVPAGETAARRAVVLAPDDAEAHYALGLALFHQERLPAAEASMRRALEIQPGHLGALTQLIKIETRLGNDDMAHEFREAHQEALRQRHVEERVRGRRQAAVAAFNREEYTVALEELQAILLEDPKDYQVHLFLGSTYLALGDNARARAALQRSLELEPRSERGLLELGRLNAMENRLDDAVRDLERAAAINPDFPEPHYFLAGIHMARGDMERSRKEMEMFETLRSRAGGLSMELAPGAAEILP
jgi:tetratricopeptide (TPR) repeat protein